MNGSTSTGTTGFTGGAMTAATVASSLFTVYSIVKQAYGFIPDGPQKKLAEEYILNYAASFLGFSSWISFTLWTAFMAAAPSAWQEDATFQNRTYSAAETVGGLVSQGRKVNEALNMVFGEPVVEAAKSMVKAEATKFATTKAIPATVNYLKDQSSYLYEAIRQTDLKDLSQKAAASVAQLSSEVGPILERLDNKAFEYSGYTMPAAVAMIAYYNQDQILQIAQAVAEGTKDALSIRPSEMFEKLPRTETKTLPSGEVVQVSDASAIDSFRSGLFDKIGSAYTSADDYLNKKGDDLLDALSRSVPELPSWRRGMVDDASLRKRGLTNEEIQSKFGPNLFESLYSANEAFSKWVDAKGVYRKQSLADAVKEKQTEFIPTTNIQDAIDQIQSNAGTSTFAPGSNVYEQMMNVLGRGIMEGSGPPLVRTHGSSPVKDPRPKPKKKHIEGRGTSAHISEGVPRKKDEYKQFGKYLVNSGMLDDGVVSMRSKGGWRIKNNKNHCVGGSVKGVLKALLDSKAPSNDDLLALTDEEKEYINKLTKSAGVGSWQEVPTEAKSKNEKLVHEFEKMRGIIAAGNDNPQLVKDFKRMLVQLIQSKQIDRNQAHDILMELTVLGY